MILYQTLAEVKLHHPDICMVRLCHSQKEAEEYIRGWSSGFFGVPPICLPVWKMTDRLYIIFTSERKNRK